MKRRSLWVTSILSLLVVVTLAFQNCNNKKFATSASNLNGSLDSMDSNGNIDGEVVNNLCDSEEEIAAGDCPESAIVRFYAIEENGSKTLIGDIEASLKEETVNGEKKYSYTFSFPVPSQHTCKVIEAYAIDPVTNAEVLIEPKPGFLMWGNKASCEEFEPVDPTPGGGAAVEIEGTNQDGRLVEVYGSCKSGTAVKFSGDLNALIFKEDACTNDKFKHCDFLSKDSSMNSITAKQTVNAVTAEDTTSIMGKPPILVFTFDSFAKSGSQGITISGKCTAGGQITLTIYNSPVATFACPSNGMYSNTGNYLVAGLSNRVMYGKMETIHGNVEIKSDVDSESANINCAITSLVPRTDFCTKQAGTISGTCTVGLPVHVYVGDNKQNIGYCPSGTFTVKNVLLEKSGVNQAVKVQQVNPYGRSCTAQVTSAF